MKGLKVKVLDRRGNPKGPAGTVMSEAFMHDDGEFYVIVLIGGEFIKTRTDQMRVVPGVNATTASEQEAAMRGES